MPTSVLLAVLAAAGLLALAPALTRRYDATERVAAERATSTARVLSRRRRRRTVPGPRPINPPRFLGLLRGSGAGAGTGSGAGGSGVAAGRAAPRSAARRRAAPRMAVPRRAVPAARRSRRRALTPLQRRRRVFLALVLLNLVELAGVLLVGPGFLIGFAVTFAILLVDLVYLRRRAVAAARLRSARARRTAWVAQEQAAVRREHERRSSERLALLRRVAAEREEARREAARQSVSHVERYIPRTAPGS